MVELLEARLYNAPQGRQHISPGQSAAPPWLDLTRTNEALKGRNATQVRMSPSWVEWLKSGATRRIRMNTIDL